MNPKAAKFLRFAVTLGLAMCALELLSATEVAACPMCKAALASQDDGGNLVQGFMWSILFMVSMPFAILGTFCGCMYVAVRRARVSQVQTTADENKRSQSEDRSRTAQVPMEAGA